MLIGIIIVLILSFVLSFPLYVFIAWGLNRRFKGDRFFGPVPENQILMIGTVYPAKSSDPNSPDAKPTLAKLVGFVSNIRGPHDPDKPDLGNTWLWPDPKRNYQIVRDTRRYRRNIYDQLVWEITGLEKLSWNPFAQVVWYQYRWPALRKPQPNDPPGKEMEVVWREEPVRSLFYLYDYPVLAQHIEIDKSVYTVDFLLLPRLRITNPFTALITNQPSGIWIQRVIGDILERLSDYAIQYKYKDLRAEQEKKGEAAKPEKLPVEQEKKGGTSRLVDYLMDPVFNGNIGESMLGAPPRTGALGAKFGAIIDNVDWPSLSYPEDIRKVLRLEQDAIQKGKAAKQDARAYKATTKIRTEADEERAKKLYAIQTKDEHAVAVTQAEAAVKSAEAYAGLFKGQVLSVNTQSPGALYNLPPQTTEEDKQKGKEKSKDPKAPTTEPKTPPNQNT